MINANDEVKLTGVVSTTGTGEFTVQVKEFYVDGAWHKRCRSQVRGLQ